MPYTLYSPHSPGDHEVLQWNYRDFETEAEITGGRNIVAEFDKLKDNPLPLKIVEAGCGLGGWVKYFKNQGQDVIGIEYVESVVQRAKEADPEIPIQIGDITALSFPDNFFDVYVSLGVLEHFKEGPDRALREAHRIVKPQGLVFIAIPLLTPLRRLVSHPLRDLYFFLNRLRGKKKYFWEYRYAAQEFELYLRKNNFDIISKCVDDYSVTEKDRQLGLWADFFFLRAKDGIWQLNATGRLLLRLFRFFLSPWSITSGIMFTARVTK